jgi:PAS domain S-box-containing protein
MNESVRVSIDHLLEGVFIIDRQLRFVYLNGAAAINGQRPIDELIGYSVTERYPGIESTEVFGALSRVMESGQSERLRTLFTFPSGDQRWFDVLIDPVPNGVCALSLDITQQVHAEAERVRLSKALEHQRMETFRATMNSVVDIVNNFLNGLQLIRVECEGRLAPEFLELFDQLTHNASERVKALANLHEVTERKMAIGDGIANDGTQG